jgi:hypothetical protein
MKVVRGGWFFPLFLAGMASIGAFAQNAEVVGKVVDGVTAHQIPYAQVQIEDLNVSVTADSAGNFSLKNLPEQDVTMSFSADQYETFVAKFTLDSRQILNVRAQLKPVTYFHNVKVQYVDDQSNNSYSSSILKNPDMVFEGGALTRIGQSSTNFDTFLMRIANMLGARYDAGFYFLSSNGRAARPQAAIVMVNGVYVTDNYNSLPFLPREVTRVEIYKPNGAGAAILGSRGYGGAINLFTKENKTVRTN